MTSCKHLLLIVANVFRIATHLETNTWNLVADVYLSKKENKGEHNMKTSGYTLFI